MTEPLTAIRAMLREVRAELKGLRDQERRLERAAEILAAEPSPKKQRRQRKPLEYHEARVVEYLGQHGPTTRTELYEAVGVPQSTLSRLVQVSKVVGNGGGDGMVALRETVVRPGVGVEPGRLAQ